MSWALYLSIGIEIAALSALAAISARMGSKVYVPFGIVTLIQFVGNIFFAFEFIKIDNLQFLSWVELTGPILEYMGIEQGDLQSHRRFLAIFAGGMLPLISLSFLHMLVKFNEENDDLKEEDGKDTKKVIEEETKIKPSEEDLNKLQDLLSKFKPEERTNEPTTTEIDSSDVVDKEMEDWDGRLEEDFNMFGDTLDEKPPEWLDEGPEPTEEEYSEWDEDHALDVVMNDMVKDFTEEDFKEIEVNEPEELIEEHLQTIIDNDQKMGLWDSKEKEEEGLLPDTVESVELDLQTGQISTPEPIKKIDVEIDEDQFTPKNNFEVDVEVNPSPTPTPTSRPNPNFIVGEIENEIQDQIDPEKKK
tara:strand:+ start:5835 stop:6914 length:1080 start_codon:yes stop_codon:yes gene_type:complete